MKRIFERGPQTFGTIAAALLMLAVGGAAKAVDITGTWVGKEKCKCFDNTDGKFREKFSDEEIKITQNGTDLNILVFEELFNGNVIDHPANQSRGEAAFIACRTNPKDNASFGEIGLAKVHTKGGGGGKLKVESLWNVSQTEICRCKWKFKRTDTADPEIDDCP